jgi:diguanylate cyclase (GGDEF)-like protein
MIEVVVLPTAPAAIRVLLIASAVPLLLLALAMLKAPEKWLRAFWLPAPLIGIAAITFLDLVSRDATAGGQVFFCFPVLYAASQLRIPAAAAVTALAVTGDGIVCFSLLEPQRAMTDFIYVSIALVTSAIILMLAGHRVDRLIVRLRNQAAMDTLTGLATRRVLDEATARAVATSGTGVGAALLVLDVDRFKDVNDQHGHPVGDRALQHVAEILRVGVRGGDTLSRMGGDELAVLMPRCSFTDATARANQLVEAVRGTPLELKDGTLVALSVSVGVSHVPQHASDVRELYAIADAALYSAKRGGRDRVGVPA